MHRMDAAFYKTLESANDGGKGTQYKYHFFFVCSSISDNIKHKNVCIHTEPTSFLETGQFGGYFIARKISQ